jgi:hypothetical protein
MEKNMKNKNLGIALLLVAVFTNATAKEDRKVYQPKSPWPLVVVEDAVVGTAGVLTLGQTDADPTALPMTIPDAIPGVSYARTKDNDSCCDKKKMKKECKKESTKVKKEKSCKKSCDSQKKTTRTKKTKNNDGRPAEVVVLPVAVAADVVTLDTQKFTRKTVNSINGDCDTEYGAE